MKVKDVVKMYKKNVLVDDVVLYDADTDEDIGRLKDNRRYLDEEAFCYNYYVVDMILSCAVMRLG